MGSRCKRCIDDYINGQLRESNRFCYTSFLRDAHINVCVVCFKDINNRSQICGVCKEYKLTIEITKLKIKKS